MIRILIGNKTDTPNRQVTFEEGQKLADSLEIQFFETSAKNGINIEKVFMKAAEALCDYMKSTKANNNRQQTIGAGRSINSSYGSYLTGGYVTGCC